MPQADSRSTIPTLSLPKALPLATRKVVAAAIRQHMAATEALIAFLDRTDGDPDLEPSFGFVSPSAPANIDLEGDGADDEPSLAHTNDFDQERATHNLRPVYCHDVDVEAEHDGREPVDETDGLHDGELDTADDEPLASPETCGGSYGADIGWRGQP